MRTRNRSTDRQDAAAGLHHSAGSSYTIRLDSVHQFVAATCAALDTINSRIASRLHQIVYSQRSTANKSLAGCTSGHTHIDSLLANLHVLCCELGKDIPIVDQTSTTAMLQEQGTAMQISRSLRAGRKLYTRSFSQAITQSQSSQHASMT